MTSWSSVSPIASVLWRQRWLRVKCAAPNQPLSWSAYVLAFALALAHALVLALVLAHALAPALAYAHAHAHALGDGISTET